MAELDRQQVTELYAMRTVLEGAAARLSAQHVSDAEIDAMEGLLERAETVSGDPGALAEINRQFHRAILVAIANAQ